MASGYALPTNGGSHHQHIHHGHSHSYSGSPYLSPNPNAAGANGFAHSPQHSHGVKKAGSHGSLYTHAETSRETSPLASPSEQKQSWHTPFETNTGSFEQQKTYGELNGHHANGHKYTKSWSPMKSGRARGESDLGRPADPRSAAYRPTLDRLVSEGNLPPASTSWFSLPEALTAMLIPLPYMLASAAYSSISGEELGGGTHPLPAYAQLQHGGGGQTVKLPKRRFSSDSGLIEACTLTSGTLLLVGILAKMRSSERQLDRRKGSTPRVGDHAIQTLLSLKSAQDMTLRSLSLGLPFYAAMQIGGLRTGLVLLATHAAGLTGVDTGMRRSLFSPKHILSALSATAIVIGMSMVLDFTGLTFQAPFMHMLSGYLALFISVLLLPLPLPALATGHRTAWSSTTNSQVATSPFTASTADVNMTLISGILVSVITVAISMFWQTAPPISSLAMTFSTLAIAAMSAAIFFAQPHTLRGSQYQAGLGLGCLLTACCSFLYSPSIWPGTVCNGGLSALSFLGVWFDVSAPQPGQGHDHHHDHEHAHAHSHLDHHRHAAAPGSHSGLTQFLLDRLESGSLLHGILSEKDSRRIAYFTTLNFAFMFVQGVYGYISGSLGLLSDTVHMFFDCLGLVVGLAAAVASKFPPTPEKPYGWGKLNTLAGFGNGVFLMLVSVEFVWEAIEGIVEHKELRHVQELLVVSVAGLLVNMVGLFAFGHAHAGHDHGHDHGHSHGGHDHGHGHGHNENMHGIFLHVAADAGGSLAVIISTGLTLWKPWYLWDPAATILIAILIFAAAVPLVVSSGQKLLLVIPEAEEYSIKNVLQDLGELRGVVGYAVPRFWIDDADAGAHSHAHEHNHGDDHGHGCSHSHEHSHSQDQHSHDHAHKEHAHDHHDHSHSHGHAHSHDHHSHDHSHTHDNHHHKESKSLPIKGVIHIIASYNADPDDVLQRVTDFTRERGMDLVIHVETEGDGPCWCGGAGASAHLRNGSIGGAALANMMSNGGLGGIKPKPTPLLKVG